MKKILILLTAFVVTATSFAQDEAYVGEVKKCIKSNGTYAYYENVVDKMVVVLKKQYASQDVPETVWNKLNAVKEESLKELSLMIVSAYYEYYTHEDVKNMNALYATKAGQNMFKSESEITEDDKMVLTEFYLSETGQKITDSQDFMNDSMSSISELWSNEFYNALVAKLSENGFKL